jgi:hypothetical protein
MDSAEAAAFGNFAAAQLVQQYGARLRRIEDYGHTLTQFKAAPAKGLQG